MKASNPPVGGEKQTQERGLLKMGVPGLDDVLGGGLTAHRLYLLEGAPGAGKTTVAIQFCGRVWHMANRCCMSPCPRRRRSCRASRSRTAGT